MPGPIVNDAFVLKKIPGKGGWTYADLPQVVPGTNTPFGWVKVKGTIDGVAISKYHLMPSGNGNLFLPVKAEIREKIKKEAGDTVHVILYPDDVPSEMPEEMLLCLQDEPAALRFFNSLKDEEKQDCIKWVYSAKTDDAKTERLAELINSLAAGRRLSR